METAIITVRWESKRFPGKSLEPLIGKPLLQHVVDNARKLTHSVGVATSTNSTQIQEYCEQHGISWMAGPEDDVLMRLAQAATFTNTSHIIRLWGDNPFSDTYYRIEKKDLIDLNKRITLEQRILWNEVDEAKVYEEHGIPVEWTYGKNMSIDTPKDLKEIEAYMRRP